VGVENKDDDAYSFRMFILTKMSMVINDFEKLKMKYESCPDFCDIYATLKDGSTRDWMDIPFMKGIYF